MPLGTGVSPGQHQYIPPILAPSALARGVPILSNVLDLLSVLLQLSAKSTTLNNASTAVEIFGIVYYGIGTIVVFSNTQTMVNCGRNRLPW